MDIVWSELGIGSIDGSTAIPLLMRLTAAAIWLTAAVGLAAAAGMYLAATIATVITLIVLRPLRAVECDPDAAR